jgi:Holliday junction resolvase RusA-like endonuclease
MTTILHLTVPGAPVAWARARVRRDGRMYTHPKQVAAMDNIRWLAKEAGWEPLEGPVMLTVEAFMPIPASWSKKRQARVYGRFHTVKPDLGNLVKLVEDSLNGVGYSDDAQIARYGDRTGKLYSSFPRLEITVWSCTSWPLPSSEALEQ